MHDSQDYANDREHALGIVVEGNTPATATITEVPNDQVRVPDVTPTQAAFRMLMSWARETMPDGNRRMPDGMLNAACMHMVAALCAGYANETGEDILPGLHKDMDMLFADYKQADTLRRAKPTEVSQ